MKELLKSLQAARKYIADKKFEKKGKNNYSNYNYFTPEQIFSITQEAEFETGLISVFDLIEENQSIFGILTIFHIDTGQKIELKMRSDIPDIKATNLTQKLGGAVTYTHRYLLTNVYKIAENQLDFDSNENTLVKGLKKEPIKVPKKEPKKEIKSLDIFSDKENKNPTKEFINAHNYIHIGKDGKFGTIDEIKKHYKLSKETEKALLDINYLDEYKLKLTNKNK